MAVTAGVIVEQEASTLPAPGELVVLPLALIIFEVPAAVAAGLLAASFLEVEVVLAAYLTVPFQMPVKTQNSTAVAAVAADPLDLELVMVS